MNIVNKISLISLFTLGSAASTFAAGCCGGMEAMAQPSCHTSAAVAQTNAASNTALSQPVQTVLDNYLKVQSNLAKDSIEGLPESAKAIVAAVENEKGAPAQISQQAQVLADAKDIDSAREALKPLSKSLIDYLRAQKALGGSFKEAYCPMAKASWIQTEPEIINPYMGSTMLHCGQFRS